MRTFRRLCLVLPLFLASWAGAAVFRPIAGFDDKATGQLKVFLAGAAAVAGRNIAVFDGDGTTFGQVPHYLADECLYLYAKDHPERKPEVIERMRKLSNVSLPYVQDRVHFFAGLSLQALRDLGDSCFKRYYPTKIYKPMRDLIALLKENGFEVWIISASPEGLYQGFLSRELGIPVTRVIGVKSVIRDGIVTDEIVPPVPQDKGKKEAIETFVQDRPLLVAGNSRGDKEMIEYSRGLRMMVNPDVQVAEDQKESMADYALRNGWLVVHVRDVPEPGFPAVTSREFGVRTNKTWDWK
jgi:phosphoserine phosphatase